MRDLQIDRGRAIARTSLAKINIGLIKAAGARRQGHAQADLGDRSPAALGPAPVNLASIEERRPDLDARPGQPKRPARPDELVTPLGKKTALRRAPLALRRLGRNDARYRAALAYVDARERLGAVAGQNLQGSGGGGISDGGAVSRTEIARLLSRLEAAVNGWQWDEARHAPRRGSTPLLVMKPHRRAAGNQQPITALALIDGILLDGMTSADILAAAGWSYQSAYVGRLNRLFIELLEEMVGPLAASRVAFD